MKKNVALTLASLALLTTFNSQLSTVLAQGTAFTYQARLNSGGSPANGSYDFRFRLALDPLGNTYAGSPFPTNGIAVNNGVFTTTVDFGPRLFTGSNYWLEVDVRTNGAAGYTVLSPLQLFTSTPYAMMASSAAVANSVLASNISGTLADARLSSNVPLLTANQTFTGQNTFNNPNGLSVSGPVSANSISPAGSLTIAGDIAMAGGAANYHNFSLSGGNSYGFLYGAYNPLGDGIHLGYNFYYDANGNPHVPNTGGGTSRISAGYGAIALLAGGVDIAPSSGLTVYAGSVDVTMTSNGIGINNPNPQAPIDLYGTIAYRNNGRVWTAGSDATGVAFGFWTAITGSAVAYIDTSGNYHQSSDRELKRDITSLDNTLERLLKLRPVSYHFRSAGTNAPLSLGFIAQEVQPLFPEVVGEQTNGVKDMVYSELIPVAIRSIQELNQKVEAKDATIQDQAEEIADLKARLEKLEQLINSQKGNGM